MKMLNSWVFAVWVTGYDMECSMYPRHTIRQYCAYHLRIYHLPIGNSTICRTPHYAKCTDGIQPISILDAMQFHAVAMPVLEQPSCTEFLFGSPRDILYNFGNFTRASVWYHVYPIFCGKWLEKGEKKRVGFCCFGRGHVFFVQDIVKEGCKLDNQQIRFRINYWGRFGDIVRNR